MLIRVFKNKKKDNTKNLPIFQRKNCASGFRIRLYGFKYNPEIIIFSIGSFYFTLLGVRFREGAGAKALLSFCLDNCWINNRAVKYRYIFSFFYLFRIITSWKTYK